MANSTGKLGAKPKLKNVDGLFGLGDTMGMTVTMLDIDSLVAYKNHPFHLYQGERLDDMVESIRKNGVMSPILVRELDGAYEILAGHNRTNAATIAGLKDIPAIILEDITDEVAAAYVIETNLIQRSFTDMNHSEKAAVIASHYTQMFSQGKRNDIKAQVALLFDETAATSSHSETKLRTDEQIGETYGLSRATVARYLRIDKLDDSLKYYLDIGELSFLSAVELSFLREKEQEYVADWFEFGISPSVKNAKKVREYSKASPLSRWTIEALLQGGDPNTFGSEECPPEPVPKPRKVNIGGDVFTKYFDKQKPKVVENTIAKALQMYFENGGGLAD